MTLDFEKYGMKGNEFLNRLEINLGVQDRSHAARILRNTFRVFRNHLTFEESLQLLAQLPMAIKAVYVDGWSMHDHVKLKTLDDFLIELLEEEGDRALRDFRTVDEVIEAVRAVIDTMKTYVSEEEVEQALGTLPAKVRAAFESTS
jgi:uncharacterized protein (DUF2267 family)